MTLLNIPNIVWICADDYSHYVSGTYGDPLVRTPHIDHLASQSIKFENCYCNSPLSTPSRQAFWTGRYPHSIGVTLSITPLPENETTLPFLLKNAGYETVAFGKTHYYAPRKHEFDIYADHLDYYQWLKNKLKKKPFCQILGPWKPFWDKAAIWLNSMSLPYAYEEDMPDTFYTNKAVEYLHLPKKKPFFLYVSYCSNHSPFRFPIEFRNLYTPQDFSIPEILSQDYEHLPKVFADLSREEKQGILASYYTAVEYMDKNVGTVLGALENAQLADNTLVIFNNDHGYMLGQHGRFEKHCCYEPAVNTGLIMRRPSKIVANTTCKALIEQIDLMPTILDICNIKVPKNIQGKSFIHLLQNKKSKHRSYAISVYSGNEEAMIRTLDWKLIYTVGKWPRRDGYQSDRPPQRKIQLFNMANDPGENIDLSNEKQHANLKEVLLKKLAKHMKATARYPKKIQKKIDIHCLLAICLRPNDFD